MARVPRLHRIRPFLLNFGAKLLCSAVFVSGRDVDEALTRSVYPRLGPRRDDVLRDVHVDRDRGLVRLAGPDGAEGVARFCGDQGCTIVPANDPAACFEPVPVVSLLPPASEAPWPMGDDDASSPPPDTGLQAGLVDRALEAAFAPAACTAAMCVVHRGRIVGERYSDGTGPDTQLESWSMGKSVTATLVGILVREGALRLDDPAAVPAWRRRDDPRSGITIAHLLRMSSGLRFSGAGDRVETVPDHVRIYMEPMDVFDFATSAEAEHPPDTVGRYRNCDPLALGMIVRDTVVGRGEAYLSWPQRALFDRIGVRRQVLECDRFGNFVMTGFDYATARNWARLGLLYLNRGVAGGDGVLSEDYVDFVSAPAPAWASPEYGGLFWLNGAGAWPLPPDAYSMSGDGIQRCIIVPSLDLVVVRLGHTAGAAAAGPALAEALALLSRAAGAA